MIFFYNSGWFWQYQNFFCMSSVGKMNVSLKILSESYLSPEGLEKTFIDFSNNPFAKETGIIKLFH